MSFECGTEHLPTCGHFSPPVTKITLSYRDNTFEIPAENQYIINPRALASISPLMARSPPQPEDLVFEINQKGYIKDEVYHIGISEGK